MNLSQLYSDLSFPGSFSGADKFYREVKKIHPSITRSEIQKYLKSNESYTSHRKVTRPKYFRRTYASRKNDIWQIDLLDYQKYKSENNNYRYVLCMIDVYTRVLRVKPLYFKTAQSVVKAMSLLLLTLRPKRLHGDEGGEWFNKKFKRMMEAFGCTLYHTFSKQKASIVERVQRTLRLRIARAMTHNKNHNWVFIIDRIVQSYNESTHRTLKMSPNQAAMLDNRIVYKALYPRRIIKHHSQLNVGDIVKLKRNRKQFEKEAQSGWSTEKYTIKAKLGTLPITYSIVDSDGVEVKGSFYREQLQHVT